MNILLLGPIADHQSDLHILGTMGLNSMGCNTLTAPLESFLTGTGRTLLTLSWFCMFSISFAMESGSFVLFKSLFTSLLLYNFRRARVYFLHSTNLSSSFTGWDNDWGTWVTAKSSFSVEMICRSLAFSKICIDMNIFEQKRII